MAVFEVIASDYSASTDAVADIIGKLIECGFYGATAGGCFYGERFDDAWPEIQECIGGIETLTEVILSRNPLGSLVLACGTPIHETFDWFS